MYKEKTFNIPESINLVVQLTYLILILSKCAVVFHIIILENKNLFQILG